ncbi:hypothetical protein [Mycoplasma struthionis]|uniref:Transglutaminase domain-containing protein n=1 Tax=Mycoplasma struthionis TaxID=538220 RepID=A0A502M2H1_9MOLU|nr:hypothetical protein [Mycoplasma struthionis]TPI01913.1 hypothetical protein FJM01_01460 [Mycoplasma struthionis]
MKSKKLLILLTPAALAIPMMAASCDFGSKKSSGPILVSTTGGDGISSGDSSSSNGNTNSGSAGSSNGSGSSANGNSANINPGSTNTNERPSNDSPSPQPPVNPPSAPVNNGPTLGMSPALGFTLAQMRRNITTIESSASLLPEELRTKYNEMKAKLEKFISSPATPEIVKQFEAFQTEFYAFMPKLNEALQNATLADDPERFATVDEIKQAWIKAVEHLKEMPIQKGVDYPNNAVVPTVKVEYPQGKVIRNKEEYAALQDFMLKDLDKYPYLSIASNGSWVFKNGLGGTVGDTYFQRNDLDEAGIAKREYAKKFVLSQFYEGMTTLEKAYVIMKFVTENLNYSTQNGHFLETAYLNHFGVCKEYVDMMMWLLSAAKIPFKVGTGDTHIFLAYQLEDGTWVYADPTFVDTSGEVTLANETTEVIGQTSDPELDQAAAWHTYRSTPSVDLDKAPANRVNLSWQYFPYDMEIPANKTFTRDYFNSHYMKKIYDMSYDYKDGRISAFQYYHGKFYFVFKKNQGDSFKIRTLDVKTNAEEDLTVRTTIAKPLLNEYNGTLYFLKTDKIVMSYDIKTKKLSEFFTAKSPILKMNLLRDSNEPKLIINGNNASTKEEKAIPNPIS